jgi:hypothetical protein
MKSGSSFHMLGLLGEGDALLGDFCFESVESRNATFVDEIVDGIDVAPGFESRIIGRFDHIEVNAIGEEVAPAKERDHFCRPPAGEEKSVAETIADYGGSHTKKLLVRC